MRLKKRAVRRAKPMEQGDAKRIKDLFLKPMALMKPDGVTLMQWLEYLWGVGDREITQWVVRESFTIIGLNMEVPLRPLQGVGERHVPVGTLVWVRTDERHDSYVDIELNIGQGQKEHVYRITDIQWLRVRPKLESKETQYQSPGGAKNDY